MKPKSTLSSFLIATGSTLLAVSSLQAATFYWDNNGTTAGFGNAGGTWAQNSTSGGTSARWKTDVTGVAAGSATQATTDADIFNFGTDTSGLGAGTITVSGSVTMGDTFYGAASGAIVLSGGTAINFGAAKTITVNNASNTINTVIGGAATSLTKAGPGTLVLTAANTYTGTTIINGGTLDLGGGTATGSLTSTALTLGGGAFSHTRTGTNAQAFTSGTTINAGASTVTTNNASNTIDLGGLTRTAKGGVLSISGTGTITTTTDNTNGILGGWAVLDNAGSVTDWAFSPGSGSDITGGVTYDQTSTLLDTASGYANKNVDVNSSQTPDGAISANSLRFNAGSAQTLTLQGANTLVSGGILVTNTLGNAPSITGGTLTGSASGDLIVHQYQTTNGLTIGSQVVDNVGATALTKAGPGLLTLNGNNTFTGGVFIHGGRIALGNAGAINSSTPNNVTYGAGSTGTLSLAGNNLTIPVLITNATSAGTTVIENASATNATLSINSASNSRFAGIIQNGTGAGTLALAKAGGGTLTLSGANTYSGGTTLSAGTVAISNATALGGGSVSVTGNSRINAAALTYANDISIDATRILTIGTTGAASSTSTFSGAITGDGSITLAQGVNSGTVVNLSNTGNTFTGNITLPAAAGTNDFINFASIGDGGSIIYGRASWLANVRYTGASNLEFNTRAIALATTFGITSGFDGGGNPAHMFENNGAGTVTINTAMQMTSTTTSGFFFLGGNNAGNNTFAGAIGDPSGTNTLGIGKSGTGKWILSNNTNSFEGNVLLLDGTLSVGVIDVAANAQLLGKGSLIQLGYRTANIGTLEYTGSANAVTDKQIQLGQLSNSTNGNFAGGGVILNNGDGTLTFSNTTFNSTVGVPGTGTGINRTLTLGGTNTGANTISGTIQDNNTAIGARLLLTKTGAGTWKLSGNNTYSGGTTLALNGGILAISHANALGTGTVHNNTNNTAVSQSTLQLDFTVPGSGPGSSAVDPNVIANNFTFSSQNLLAAGGFANIQNAGGFNRISGSLTISTTGGTGANIVSDAGHLELAGNLTTTVTGPSNRAFNFGGTGNGTVSGIISNGATSTVPITKSGLGTWTLTNANAFTGATTITGGTLALSSTGSIATSASVAIGSAGTLDTSAQTTYTIPGAQPVQFGIDPAGSGSSGKIVAAGLDISSAVVTFTGTPDDPVYVLATYTSLTGTQFASVTPPGGYTLNYTYEGNKIALVQSAGSPYDTWATAKSLTEANKAKNLDPDNDGRNNLGEFAFNGDPLSGSDNGKVFVLTEDSDIDGDAIKELILTVAVRSGTPAFAGSPSPAANFAAESITYSIEGSLDLASFPTTVTPVTPVTTGLPSAGTGYEYRSFSLNGSNGLTGKGFLRAKATSP